MSDFRNTYNLQVQIQLTSCYNNIVYCPCGIAIRAGADVFVMNFCDGWSTIQFVACEHAPVLYVAKMKRSNQHYQVSTTFFAVRFICFFFIGITHCLRSDYSTAIHNFIIYIIYSYQR